MIFRYFGSIVLCLSVAACATGRWEPQITQIDEFECKQKCGVYDSRQSIVFASECTMACYRAKGYNFVMPKQ